jgi:hypothetical protein
MITFKLLAAFFLFVQPPCIKNSLDKNEFTKHDKGMNIHVANCSGKLRIFYRVGLAVKADTDWVRIQGDIDNLRRNEIIGLYQLNAHEKTMKRVDFSFIPAKYFTAKKTLFKLRVFYSANRDYTIANKEAYFQEVEFAVLH